MAPTRPARMIQLNPFLRPIDTHVQAQVLGAENQGRHSGAGLHKAGRFQESARTLYKHEELNRSGLQGPAPLECRNRPIRRRDLPGGIALGQHDSLQGWGDSGVQVVAPMGAAVGIGPDQHERAFRRRCF